MASRFMSNTAGAVLMGSILGVVCNVSVASTSPQLQTQALLHTVDSSVEDLPKTINTLDLVAESQLRSGVVIKVWRYATKYGEGG
jgi:DNA-directed RNA polymerase subunit H (RpoH/RPB5)